MNPESETVIDEFRIEKDKNFSKFRVKKYSPFECIIPEKDNQLLEIQKSESTWKISKSNILVEIMYAYIENIEPTLCKDTSMHEFKCKNLLGIMKSLQSLTRKLSWTYFENNESKDMKLIKFWRIKDWDGHIDFWDFLSRMDFHHVNASDGQQHQLFYNMFDVIHRKLICLAITLFKEQKFRVTLMKSMRDKKYDKLTELNLSQFMHIFYDILEKEDYAATADSFFTNPTFTHLPPEFSMLLQWAQRFTNHTRFVEEVEEALHSPIYPTDLFVLYKCKLLQWRLLSSKLDERKDFIIFPKDLQGISNQIEFPVLIVNTKINNISLVKDMMRVHKDGILVYLKTPVIKFALSIVDVAVEQSDCTFELYQCAKEVKSKVFQLDYDIPYVVVAPSPESFVHYEMGASEISLKQTTNTHSHDSWSHTFGSEYYNFKTTRTYTPFQYSKSRIGSTVNYYLPTIISNMFYNTAIYKNLKDTLGTVTSIKLLTSEFLNIRYLDNEGKEIKEEILNNFCDDLLTNIPKFIYSYEDYNYYNQNYIYKSYHYKKYFNDNKLYISKEFIDYQIKLKTIVSPESFILFINYTKDNLEYVEKLLLDQIESINNTHLNQYKIMESPYSINYNFKNEYSSFSNMNFIIQLCLALFDEKELRFKIIEKIERGLNDIQNHENYFKGVYDENIKTAIKSVVEQQELSEPLSVTEYAKFLNLTGIYNNYPESYYLKHDSGNDQNIAMLVLYEGLEITKSYIIHSESSHGLLLKDNNFKSYVKVYISIDLNKLADIINTICIKFNNKYCRTILVNEIHPNNILMSTRCISITAKVSSNIYVFYISDSLNYFYKKHIEEIYSMKNAIMPINTYQLLNSNMEKEAEVEGTIYYSGIDGLYEYFTKKTDYIKAVYQQYKILDLRDIKLNLYEILVYNYYYYTNQKLIIDPDKINKYNFDLLIPLSFYGVENYDDFLDIVSKAKLQNKSIIEVVINQKIYSGYKLYNFANLIKYSKLTRKLDLDYCIEYFLDVISKNERKYHIYTYLIDLYVIYKHFNYYLDSSKNYIMLCSKFQFMQGEIFNLALDYKGSSTSVTDFFKGIYQYLNAYYINMYNSTEKPILLAIETYLWKMDLSKFDKNIFDYIYDEIELHKQESIQARRKTEKLENDYTRVNRRVNDQAYQIEELEKINRTNSLNFQIKLDSQEKLIAKEYNQKVEKYKSRVTQFEEFLRNSNFDEMALEGLNLEEENKTNSLLSNQQEMSMEAPDWLVSKKYTTSSRPKKPKHNSKEVQFDCVPEPKQTCNVWTNTGQKWRRYFKHRKHRLNKPDCTYSEEDCSSRTKTPTRVPDDKSDFTNNPANSTLAGFEKQNTTEHATLSTKIEEFVDPSTNPTQTQNSVPRKDTKTHLEQSNMNDKILFNSHRPIQSKYTIPQINNSGRMYAEESMLDYSKLTHNQLVQVCMDLACRNSDLNKFNRGLKDNLNKVHHLAPHVMKDIDKEHTLHLPYSPRMKTFLRVNKLNSSYNRQEYMAMKSVEYASSTPSNITRNKFSKTHADRFVFKDSTPKQVNHKWEIADGSFIKEKIHEENKEFFSMGYTDEIKHYIKRANTIQHGKHEKVNHDYKIHSYVKKNTMSIQLKSPKNRSIDINTFSYHNVSRDTNY